MKATITSLALLSAIFFGLSILSSPKASALSGSQFNAGQIIDDSVFFDSSSMSSSQIQNFLNSKVPSCDTNGTKPYGGTTRASYGTSKGYPPPYKCLKDYTQTIPNIANGGSDLCTGSISGGTKSSAQIINDVSKACKISPKVLIVLLQKEQSLVTDDWPWSVQYRSATGYGCPDTAPCDSEYYGFFNQVYQAAKAYQRYKANPNNYNYKAYRNNTVLYHPNSSCGSSNVFIQNQATAGLYIYTPYRPNSAALNNLYGTGDGCSSYGNRNFWRFFNDWFGSPTGNASYNWSVESQKAYTDNTRSTEFDQDSPSLAFGERAYLIIKVKNNGNRVWDKSIKLGADKPENRETMFCDETWYHCSRPATLKEQYVAPGEIGTFEFWIKAPRVQSSYKEYFNLLKEGDSWFPSIGLYYSINVIPPELDGTLQSYNLYKKQDLKEIVSESNIVNNYRYWAKYKVKNTGTKTWRKNGATPFRLGIENNQTSPFCDPTWITCSRPTSLKEDSVAPGEIGTFEFWLSTQFDNTGKIIPTNYKLLSENDSWLDYPYLQSNYRYNTPKEAWSKYYATSYEDSTKTVLKPTNNLNKGERVYLVIQARNLSGYTWYKSGSSPLRLAVVEPRNKTSPFCDPTWITCYRPAGLKEETVAPGEIGTFEFWIKAPSSGSYSYLEYFGLVAENSYWLGNAGLFYHFKSH